MDDSKFPPTLFISAREQRGKLLQLTTLSQHITMPARNMGVIIVTDSISQPNKTAFYFLNTFERSVL